MVTVRLEKKHMKFRDMLVTKHLQLMRVVDISVWTTLMCPSNAMEMLSFFEEALRQTNDLGNRVFARGDVVVMDNCGFHHQRAGERILRTMLDNAGVELVFQPPYSPQYNIAECVFHAMRCRLRDNTSFTENFTELAIVTALGDIPNRELANYFRLCGYV